MRDVLEHLTASVRADLATYAARAAALDRGGAMRLQVGRRVIAATVRTRAGTGLLGRGTMLGLRVMPAPGAPDADMVLALDELRAALRTQAAAPAPLGPADPRAAWVGLAPPRAGWARLGEFVVGSAEWARLLAADADPAQAALEALGFPGAAGGGQPPLTGTTAGPGRSAGRGIGDPDDEAYVVTAYQLGPWTRLAAPSGHLLLR